MMKPAREDEDTRGSPTKGHDCYPLVSGAVNTSDHHATSQHGFFTFGLKLLPLLRAVFIPTMRLRNTGQMCSEEPHVAVQPKLGFGIESRFLSEGSGTTRGFRDRANSHAARVSKTS